MAFSSIIVFSRGNQGRKEKAGFARLFSDFRRIFTKNEKKSIQKDRRSSIIFDSEGGTLVFVENRDFSDFDRFPENLGSNPGKSGEFGKSKNVSDIGNLMVRCPEKRQKSI